MALVVVGCLAPRCTLVGGFLAVNDVVAVRLAPVVGLSSMGVSLLDKRASALGSVRVAGGRAACGCARGDVDCFGGVVPSCEAPSWSLWSLSLYCTRASIYSMWTVFVGNMSCCVQSLCTNFVIILRACAQKQTKT